MGVLKDLFFPTILPMYPAMPQINTVMTSKNISDIMSGKMAAIPVRKIILKGNEKCLFCDYAVMITERLQVVGRQGNGGNFTFRIMKGMYYHTGNRGNTSIREKVPEYFIGKLYITDKRIVFSADARAFQHRLSELISYREENGSLVLQFSRNSYKIFLPIATCAEKILEYIL